MERRLFVSYRREDAAGDAGRLADHLQRRFGAERVFLDVETIDPGADFVQVLHASLRQTAAMLVVIGPRWTSARAADGTRRLDDGGDFVRLEVETALGRGIPVVPVLVQGATLPRAEELPPPLAALVTRQEMRLDHAEFHEDAERLCERLARVVDADASGRRSVVRRWWPAAVLAAALLAAGGYLAVRGQEAGRRDAAATSPGESRADALVARAATQRRRGQLPEALSTLAHAREAAPASDAIRRVQEDVAMEWIRNVRVERDKSSFGDAVEPALSVIDASLATAAGPRRADLLAHSGWATFLQWRDGHRERDPAAWYREALSVDPDNPYANAMLAHWVLFRQDDVARAAALFATALGAGRATDAVRALQWSAYANSRTPEADAERIRLADAMRRAGERLRTDQAQDLWSPYYFALSPGRERERDALLAALAPEAHAETLRWAFDEYAAGDRSRQLTLRYYVALLHTRAGRVDDGTNELRALAGELAASPGTLRDAVRAALGGVPSRSGSRR